MSQKGFVIAVETGNVYSVTVKSQSCISSKPSYISSHSNYRGGSDEYNTSQNWVALMSQPY